MLTLNTIAVVVRNEKRAMKWYYDKLGLRVVTKFPHWVTVAARGSTVRIHLCPDSKPERGNTGSRSERRTPRRRSRSTARRA